MNMNDDLRQRLAGIFGRRSIRAYADGKVSDEVVRLLLEAGMAAPSAVAKDPWRFVVMRRRETLSAVAAALPNGRMLAKAGVGMVVAGDIEAAHDRQLSFLLQDCAAAIENILLAAHMLGLGACWLGVHPREDRILKVREILGLPLNIVPVSAIAIGYPAEQREPRTRYASAYVHEERW